MDAHDKIPHPHSGLNEQIGDKISSVFGSMKTFWAFASWQGLWMFLAILGAPVFRGDPYPFTFLLFLSNIIQLLALPVLGNTQNRADYKRDLKADADHQALTYLANKADALGTKVDRIEAILRHPSSKDLKVNDSGSRPD